MYKVEKKKKKRVERKRIKETLGVVCRSCGRDFDKGPLGSNINFVNQGKK